MRVAGPRAGGVHRVGAGLPDHVPGGGADVPGGVHDVHPGEKREQEEQNHGKELPTGQHLLGFLPELEVDKKYCHPENIQGCCDTILSLIKDTLYLICVLTVGVLMSRSWLSSIVMLKLRDNFLFVLKSF